MENMENMGNMEVDEQKMEVQTFEEQKRAQVSGMLSGAITDYYKYIEHPVQDDPAPAPAAATAAPEMGDEDGTDADQHDQPNSLSQMSPEEKVKVCKSIISNQLLAYAQQNLVDESRQISRSCLYQQNVAGKNGAIRIKQRLDWTTIPVKCKGTPNPDGSDCTFTARFPYVMTTVEANSLPHDNISNFSKTIALDPMFSASAIAPLIWDLALTGDPTKVADLCFEMFCAMLSDYSKVDDTDYGQVFLQKDPLPVLTIQPSELSELSKADTARDNEKILWEAHVYRYFWEYAIELVQLVNDALERTTEEADVQEADVQDTEEKDV